MAKGQVIFQSNRAGMVQTLNLGGDTLPGIISVTGGSSDYLSKQQGVIITSIGVSQEVNAQFVASLQKVIYVYSFGDKMGKITVNGLSFYQVCENKGTKAVGAVSLLEYYDRHRAIDESRLMTISIGSYSLQGYLTSMNLVTSQPEFRIMAFTLNIISIPRQIGVKSLTSNTATAAVAAAAAAETVAAAEAAAATAELEDDIALLDEIADAFSEQKNTDPEFNEFLARLEAALK